MPAKQLLIAIIILLMITLIFLIIINLDISDEMWYCPGIISERLTRSQFQNQKQKKSQKDEKQKQKEAKNKKVDISKIENTKIENAKKYYKQLESHNNDSENVHNSTIVSSLRRKYNRLLELKPLDSVSEQSTTEELSQQKLEQTIYEIKKAATTQSEDKIAKINNYLDLIGVSRATTSSLGPEEVKETDLLVLIWSRIQHGDNEIQKPRLEEALLDQIVDSMKIFNNMILNLTTMRLTESGTVFIPVCVNGRIARFIAALTLLDADPILSAPDNDEKEIANTAYFNALGILDRELAKFNTDLDRDMTSIYQEVQNDKEREIYDTFCLHVKKEIEKELLAKYTGHISDQELEKIITNAKAGIGY